MLQQFVSILIGVIVDLPIALAVTCAIVQFIVATVAAVALVALAAEKARGCDPPFRVGLLLKAACFGGDRLCASRNMSVFVCGLLYGDQVCLGALMFIATRPVRMAIRPMFLLLQACGKPFPRRHYCAFFLRRFTVTESFCPPKH